MGDKVRFRATDVFLPSPSGALPIAEDEEELEGTITNFSDSGHKAHYFAVIEVVRTQSMIVPVEKLETIETATRDTDV